LIYRHLIHPNCHKGQDRHKFHLFGRPYNPYLITLTNNTKHIFFDLGSCLGSSSIKKIKRQHNLKENKTSWIVVVQLYRKHISLCIHVAINSNYVSPKHQYPWNDNLKSLVTKWKQKINNQQTLFTYRFRTLTTYFLVSSKYIVVDQARIMAKTYVEEKIHYATNTSRIKAFLQR